MREIKPYRTENGLMKALDNGGRLYNLMSRSGDDVITFGELAKAAGSISTGVYAFLFFDMARMELPAEALERSVAALEPSLRKEYEENRPLVLAPVDLASRGELGKAAVIEGYARPAESQAVKEARINIAISAGSGTTYEKVPLLKNFSAFEIHEDPEMSGLAAIAAAPPGAPFESGQKIRLGGVVRKLSYEIKDPRKPRLFLETIFYTRL